MCVCVCVCLCLFVCVRVCVCSCLCVIVAFINQYTCFILVSTVQLFPFSTCQRTVPLISESTLRSCPGQEARFYCRSGYRIESISIVGGFHPTPISCRGTAYCKTSYVRGALVEYDGNISAFAIDECKHKQTCHISIVQSWQSSPSYCYNNAYNISYVEVEYTCSPMPSMYKTESFINVWILCYTHPRYYVYSISYLHRLLI